MKSLGPSWWGRALLGAYLALSPIFWLPGVAPQEMRNIKLLLFVVAIGVILLGASRRGLAFPRGVIGLGGLIFVVSSLAPGLMRSSPQANVYVLQSMLAGFLLIWVSYHCVARVRDAVALLAIATIPVAVLCALVLFSFGIGWPAWSGPLEFGERPFSLTGFGSQRGVWAQATALFLPFAIVMSGSQFIGGSKVRWQPVLGFAAIVAIVGSQLAVGGRTGLIMSGVSLAILFGLGIHRRSIVFGLMLLVIGSLAIHDVRHWSGHLRVDRLEVSPGVYTADLETLDHFSAGRIQRFASGWEVIGERPLTGHGFDANLRNFGYEGTHIHNVWLRVAMQAGVFAGLSLLLFHVAVATKILTQVYKQRVRFGTSLGRILLACGVCVVATLVNATVSPSVLFGAFQEHTMWWVAVGVGAKLAVLAKAEGSAGGVGCFVGARKQTSITAGAN